MDDGLIGRVLRALRHRKGWRQLDLAAASAVSRSVISDIEAGCLEGHSVRAVRDAVRAAGGVLRVVVSVPRGEVERLLDADHARLQEHWKRWLERIGWTVEAEVTFSVYGERGSIDLLAWHAQTRTLLVIEIKTVIVDVQDTLAGLDRKARNARVLARERGWAVSAVVPALLVLEGSTARRRVAEHASLFGRFNLRGRSALAWLRAPAQSGLPTPSGVLAFTKLSPARPGDRRRAGRQRVRRLRPPSRSAGRDDPAQPADPAA